MRAKQAARGHANNGSLDAIDRLYNQLVTWLYERQDVRRALPIANRLKRLLSRFGQNPDNIFIEELRSLVYEARGDFKNAIKHRKNEIRLIRLLHKASQGTESEAYVLSQYDYADVRDRLTLLSMLYHDSGDLDKSISTLLKSKRLCERRGIRFDAGNLLRDYLKGKKDVNKDFELLIVAGNGSVSAKTLPPGTLKMPSEAGAAFKVTRPAQKKGMTKQAMRLGDLSRFLQTKP